MNDQQKLNPQQTEVEIGVREPKSLTIWPLSMADQLELSQTLEGAVSHIIMESQDDLTFVLAIKKVIEDNLVQLLMKITDYTTKVKAEKLLKDITNDQFVAICRKVYEMNFESISKNVMSLLEGMDLSLMRRPSPTSLSDTLDTDLNSSTDSDSEKED